jgi:sugar diacid utilization regulator
MIVSNDAAPEILQELCDTIANEIQAIVSIMGEGGRIIASSARERIGGVHDGAARIMSGEIDEYSVTAEEAARSRAMREGYNLAIDFRGAAPLVSGDRSLARESSPIWASRARMGDFSPERPA